MCYPPNDYLATSLSFLSKRPGSLNACGASGRKVGLCNQEMPKVRSFLRDFRKDLTMNSTKAKLLLMLCGLILLLSVLNIRNAIFGKC